MTNDLFRPEALEERAGGQRRYGRPIGMLPPAWSRLTRLFVFMFLVSGAYLYFAEFERKETVRGHLVPVSSEARIFASDFGVISAVTVEEGMTVQPDDELAIISNRRILQDGSVLSQKAIGSLQERAELLEARITTLQQVKRLNIQELNERIESAASRILETGSHCTDSTFKKIF